MRQPGKNNRQRGRGRRSGHNNGHINRNTTMDSNGPDVRLRGNAQQLHEKYIALANDASAAGERIQAEAYFQFADHYFRVNAAIIAAAEERQNRHQDKNNASPQSEKSADSKSDDQTEASSSYDQPAETEAVAIEKDGDVAEDNTAEDNTAEESSSEDQPVGVAV